jgi:predicted nucleic acid-binding protein
VTVGVQGVRLRIYADTSVIGGCFDPEFQEASRKLFDMFMAGDHVLVMSELTTTELKNAPPSVSSLVSAVPDGHKVVLEPPAETVRLAGLYLAAGVVPKHSWSDAQHIAIATLSDVDVLVSWNFKHIVNLRRIRGYNAVNSGLGYQELEIRTPREIVYGER